MIKSTQSHVPARTRTLIKLTGIVCVAISLLVLVAPRSISWVLWAVPALLIVSVFQVLGAIAVVNERRLKPPRKEIVILLLVYALGTPALTLVAAALAFLVWEVVAALVGEGTGYPSLVVIASLTWGTTISAWLMSCIDLVVAHRFAASRCR